MTEREKVIEALNLCIEKWTGTGSPFACIECESIFPGEAPMKCINVLSAARDLIKADAENENRTVLYPMFLGEVRWGNGREK